MAEIKVMTKDIKAPVARIEQAEPQVVQPSVEEAADTVDETADAIDGTAVLGETVSEEVASVPEAESPSAEAPEPEPDIVSPGQQVPSQGGLVSAWLSERFPGREHTVVGGLCGLSLALLIFTIGLWHTLVIVGFVTVGAIIGALLDGGWKPFGWVRRLTGRRRR